MVLPAENGTMARMLRVGQACANVSRGNAGAASAAPANDRNSRRVFIIGVLP
jgi:hypothetical protein